MKILNKTTLRTSNVIGIAGASCSGKTTLAKMLVNELNKYYEIQSISTDNYYFDLSHLPKNERGKINFDKPESIEFNLIEKQLYSLKKGITVHIPVYDFKTHTRVDSSYILPTEIILVEGMFLLHFKAIRSLLDLAIFVDAEPDVCYQRRIKRDMLERGRNKTSIKQQFINHVKPMYEQYIAPSKRYADLILNGNEKIDIQIVINMIKNNFKNI